MSYIRPPAGLANTGWLVASEYTRSSDATFEQDQGALGILAASLPAIVPDLTLTAQGEEWEPDYYIVPDLALPVTLRIGYYPPPQSEPVVLCSDSDYVPPGGTLQAALPPPEITVSLQAAAAPVIPGQAAATITVDALLVFEATATVEQVHNGTAAASLPVVPSPDVAATAAGTQVLDLPDNDSAGLRSRHRKSYQKSRLALIFQQRQGQDIIIPARLAHSAAIPLQNRLESRQAQMIQLRRPTREAHQHGKALTGNLGAPHSEAVRTRESIRQAHHHGLKRQGNSGMPHAETIKRRKPLGLAEQQAQPATRGLGIGNRQAWPTGTRLEVRWTKADHPAPGYWWPAYQPPGLRIVIPCEGGYQARPLRCPVILGAGYEPQPPCELDPEPPHETIIIPIREIYTVINELTLTELDGTPLQAEEFSASIDADSWTWAWSARIPASPLAQVRPDSSTRVELMATINGEPLRVLVENIQRERRFGESWLRVSGRGRAAFLADPLAPVTQYTNSASVTAQQALNATLTANGVSIGWGLDWQIEDWQIPAGIWSHNGTWIDAAKRIAEAGGAYVQGHDTDQTLIILPRYPVAPWNWSETTPDIQLPEDVVEVEGIEWQERPDYNAVWIHGGDQGRADRIIRAGTGGTNPAPTIVDELATDPAMTRQRGLALLGDTGKQATVSLRLPVLPETGLIRPGQLVEYLEQGNTRRGLVRSLSVRHQFPETWQTIGVETHE